MQRCDNVVRAAHGVWFTGAVARVEHRGVLVFERAYGTTRDDRLGLPVYPDTRFDVASLTKVFVSSTALRAVADGYLPLDAPLLEWFPEWQGSSHARITLRMLLSHTSGMHSGADYRQLFNERVERFASERALAAEPGERVIYSDLGFIALGVLLERVFGRSLASSLPGFRPGVRERKWIPATETDAWRGRMQGAVHDEKAFLMNGVAGHAGLFMSAAQVAALTERYVRVHRDGASCALDALFLQAVSEQAYDPVLRRGLGWALKTRDDNSCGRYFSPESFGHTGFVGTCVWADPVRDVQAVLLTNAVYFGRRDTRDLRVAFYEAVMEDLDLV